MLCLKFICVCVCSPPPTPPHRICGVVFSFKFKNYTTASAKISRLRNGSWPSWTTQDCCIQIFDYSWLVLFVYLFVAYFTTIFCSLYYMSVDLWNDLRFGVYVEGSSRCSVRHLFSMFLENHENPQKSSVRVVGVPTEIRTKHFLFIDVGNGKASEFVIMSINKVKCALALNYRFYRTEIPLVRQHL